RNVEDFMRVAERVEVLISPPWELRRLDLFAAKRLVLVQSTSAGVDSLMPFDGIPPGVMLANNRGTHAQKAGEYALMAILMLVNRMPFFVASQRAQAWRRRTSGVLAGQRLCVVGLGALGGAAATQARRMGMDVTGVSRSGRAHDGCARVTTLASLDEILPRMDVLLLACPLTPETAGMLSTTRIRAMKPGAGVINIGRGRLIDEAALFDALDDGHLGGAVLDVFYTEPLPPGHRAWGVKNLMITPHMSSDDPATYNVLTLQIFQRNLAAIMAGQMPPTLVDQGKGY
ncbi:MAG: D-2-hydroxyacid dehydrogenase, partial [Acidocella sp.]|nr:D-2-hydroxyacid dehydrogenase [Acidocella sp.]